VGVQLPNLAAIVLEVPLYRFYMMDFDCELCSLKTGVAGRSSNMWLTATSKW
jgi:hypothetical protein